MLKSPLFPTLSATAVILGLSTAQAGWSVSHGDLGAGAKTCFSGTLGDLGETPASLSLDVTANAKCRTKTVAGVPMIGTKAGAKGEIDALGGFMRFEFGASVILSSLEVASLFPRGEKGEKRNEQAVAKIFKGETLIDSFVLEATDLFTASWSGEGGVTNLSPARDGKKDGKGVKKGAGHWRIAGDNIFGARFDTLVLTGGAATGFKKKGSDFGFVRLSGALADGSAAPRLAASATSVSEPGAIALLAIGLIGLCSARRIAA